MDSAYDDDLFYHLITKSYVSQQFALKNAEKYHECDHFFGVNSFIWSKEKACTYFLAVLL